MVQGKFYFYWAIAEIASIVLFLRGITGWFELVQFYFAHAVTVGLTYMIYISLIAADRLLRDRIMTRGVIIFIAAIAVIPMAGPVTALCIPLFIRFVPVYPIRNESFEKIDNTILRVIKEKLAARVLPISEAFLIRTINRDDAFRMIGVLDESEWTAEKSSILKYIIRFSPYQSTILMAIDMISKKLDSILSEIAGLESRHNHDQAVPRRLAQLYHEIYNLDLCDPIMKQFYEKNACYHAVIAYKQSGTEDDAQFAVKLLLRADLVEEAQEIYSQIRAGGKYFFPKWITYEFELSIRLKDRENFNNLYALIETAGGVFVPDRVKEAAKTWKKVLTSAWL